MSARDKLLTHLGIEPGDGTVLAPPPPDHVAIKPDEDDSEEEVDRREGERREQEIKVDEEIV